MKLSYVKYTALVGMMAATVEAAKLALAAIPNVEAVSLLLALYSFVFGWAGVMAAVVFVCIEPLVWGMGTWFISYLIYWPALSLVFFILGRLRMGGRILPTAVITVMTFLFGILTSLVDIGLFSGNFDDFFYRFGIYYARGALFYAVHIGSNLVIFALLFKPLKRVLLRIKASVFRA